MTKLHEAIALVDMIENDFASPTNVKEKMKEIKKILQDKSVDIGIRANRCLNILEALDEDPNIEPFTRTNLWNLVSMLENLEE